MISSISPIYETLRSLWCDKEFLSDEELMTNIFVVQTIEGLAAAIPDYKMAQRVAITDAQSLVLIAESRRIPEKVFNDHMRRLGITLGCAMGMISEPDRDGEDAQLVLYTNVAAR